LLDYHTVAPTLTPRAARLIVKPPTRITVTANRPYLHYHRLDVNNPCTATMAGHPIPLGPKRDRPAISRG